MLAAIRRESTLARGATHGSMLRNEIYNFARAGTFIERADNTARILDVKYYLLLPSLAYVGTALDTAQWDNVLRSLSGERAYRWLNAGRMDARAIAEFLILDDRFPRSLAFCYATLRENLRALARVHGARRAGARADAAGRPAAHRRDDRGDLRARPAPVPAPVHRPQPGGRRRHRRGIPVHRLGHPIMRLAIRHTTRYRFAEPVAHGLQRLRLTPKATQGQTILDWTMDYEGAREELATTTRTTTT